MTVFDMPSFNGKIRTIAYAGNTAYLRGDFTAAILKGRRIARGHAAAVDVLLPWAPAVDGRVKERSAQFS